jgi:hypothetical protein
MKKVFVCVSFLCMTFLFGCSLLTKNSIDNGSYELKAWLNGNWILVDGGGKKENYYIESIKDEKGHLKAYPLDSLGRRGSVNYDMILSDVNGTLFLNVYQPEDEFSSEGWYIYKFNKINNKKISIVAVKEGIVDYSASSEEIKAFLAQNKDKDEIYNTSETAEYKKE